MLLIAPGTSANFKHPLAALAQTGRRKRGLLRPDGQTPARRLWVLSAKITSPSTDIHGTKIDVLYVSWHLE